MKLQINYTLLFFPVDIKGVSVALQLAAYI